MNRFDNYKFEDFLLDPDFCAWVMDKKKHFNKDYSAYFEKNPSVYKTALRAKLVLELLKDEKVSIPLTRKIQIWDLVRNAINKTQAPKNWIGRSFKYAAIIVVVVGIASLFYLNMNRDNEIDQYIASYRTDYTETVLKLDNGKEFKIASKKSEIVYNTEGDKIVINNKQYIELSEKKKARQSQLIVPFGKKSKIILEDQSEVWLNAGSQLIYPDIFDGKKREVMLIGEAFFKVAKNKEKPFVVKTGKMRIEVLGTSFNIRAYPDENIEEAVLVEGGISLALKNKIINNKVELRPNQRFVVSNESLDYNVSEVNVEDFTSWIDGVFIFNNEPLKNVLKRVSRYYNLEIIGVGQIGPKFISGKLDLKEDANKVLDAIAVISDGEYFEENGKIIFKLKNE